LHTGFSDASQGTAQKKYKEPAAKGCIKSVFLGKDISKSHPNSDKPETANNKPQIIHPVK